MHQIVCQLDAAFNEAKQNQLNHVSVHFDKLKIPYKMEALMECENEHTQKKAAALQKCFDEYEKMKAAAMLQLDREDDERCTAARFRAHQEFKRIKAWRMHEAEDHLNYKFAVSQWTSIARLMFMATGDRYCPECLKVKYQNPNATVSCGQGHATLHGIPGQESTLSAEQFNIGA
jgi:hypothetical protein